MCVINTIRECTHSGRLLGDASYFLVSDIQVYTFLKHLNCSTHFH